MIEKLEGTVREVISINRDLSAQVKELQADKDRLETENTKSNQLMRDMSEAQQITCKRFEEF